MSERWVLLVSHTGRADVIAAADELSRGLRAAGMRVRVLDSEAADLRCGDETVSEAEVLAADGSEIVVVLGGDGTLLRAAELSRASGTPLLGVNLGHVGFLAEAERDDLRDVVRHVSEASYAVQERMTIEATVLAPGAEPVTLWALNEASVEKSERERLLEMVVEVDGRPLSRWGGDGLVFATPTGSTAYAFSAGGPIVWPELEAMVLVPISAHSLFARPLVTAPTSVLASEIVGDRAAVLWCDGRRRVDVPAGARVEVRRGTTPVRLARLHDAPFTDRLVAKFALPVQGWRGRRHERH